MRKVQSDEKGEKGKGGHIMADMDGKTTPCPILDRAFQQEAHRGKQYSLPFRWTTQRSEQTNNPNPILRSPANGLQLKGETIMKNYASIRVDSLPKESPECVEIHHALLDIPIIDSVRGIALGRPWMTVGIATITGTVFGSSLTFNPPDHIAVKACLRAGITKNGVPGTVIACPGKEVHHRELVSECRRLGISLKYAPPQHKGSAERFFARLKELFHPLDELMSVSDGVGQARPGQVNIDLFTLEKLVHAWITDVYNPTITVTKRGTI